MTTEELSRLADDGCPQADPLPKIPWLEEHTHGESHRWSQTPWRYAGGTVSCRPRLLVWTAIEGDYPPAPNVLVKHIDKILAPGETLGYLTMERLREWAGPREHKRTDKCATCHGTGKEECSRCGNVDADCEDCGGSGVEDLRPDPRPGVLLIGDRRVAVSRQLLSEIPTAVTGEFAVELHDPIDDRQGKEWYMLLLRRPDLVVVVVGMDRESPALPELRV